MVEVDIGYDEYAVRIRPVVASGPRPVSIGGCVDVIDRWERLWSIGDHETPPPPVMSSDSCPIRTGFGAASSSSDPSYAPARARLGA